MLFHINGWNERKYMLLIWEAEWWKEESEFETVSGEFFSFPSPREREKRRGEKEKKRRRGEKEEKKGRERREEARGNNRRWLLFRLFKWEMQTNISYCCWAFKLIHSCPLSLIKQEREWGTRKFSPSVDDVRWRLLFLVSVCFKFFFFLLSFFFLSPSSSLFLSNVTSSTKDLRFCILFYSGAINTKRGTIFKRESVWVNYHTTTVLSSLESMCR